MKTKEEVRIPLSQNALQFIPQRSETARDDDRTFEAIQGRSCHADEKLAMPIELSGIKKHITFHCSRHTCVTLANECDMVVADILHCFVIGDALPVALS